ncbi:hypothetical protein GOP47_0001895 [Adiantum capillus-veneris]|uniref:Fe2OG dioxygenase domain-containing protein n=1 Tax=Adiantum capillus-veneris TaxID=13818 RepID=A0A9D4VAZ4_ADICA|nr:hypothetical protein GOP47_0001895 [Adiantum capillus-veneris]
MDHGKEMIRVRSLGRMVSVDRLGKVCVWNALAYSKVTFRRQLESIVGKSLILRVTKVNDRFDIILKSPLAASDLVQRLHCESRLSRWHAKVSVPYNQGSTMSLGSGKPGERGSISLTSRHRRAFELSLSSPNGIFVQLHPEGQTGPWVHKNVYVPQRALKEARAGMLETLVKNLGKLAEKNVPVVVGGDWNMSQWLESKCLKYQILQCRGSPLTYHSPCDIGPLVEKSNDPRLAESEDVAEVVRLLDTACRDVGFFYAKGHGLPTGLCKAVLRVSHEFFDCNYEEKVKIKLSSTTGFRGYQVVGQNVTKGRPDLHEAIDCYKEFDQTAYGELGKPLCAPNLWPEKPSDFKVIMEEYVQKMQDLAQKILKGIALALGGPANAFESTKAGDPFWVMRVIGYPPLVNDMQTDSFDDSAISCGAHTDYGLLTLVNQDAEPCALQVKNQAGNWIWAPHVPEAFVVNIGDMLKICSNGLYKPTLHRVINNSALYRVSVPFFLEPNFDAVIEPFEFCMDKTQASTNISRSTKPVIYGEHLVSKVSTNFSY